MNPQGRKNVPIPRMSGARFPNFEEEKILHIHSPNVTPPRMKPRRLSQRIKITTAIIILSPVEMLGESCNPHPRVPRIPQSTKNQLSLPKWKSV